MPSICVFCKKMFFEGMDDIILIKVRIINNYTTDKIIL